MYGISLSQYQKLLRGQNGSCGICGKLAVNEKKSLAVDHDHKSGEIRGLLCFLCNHKLIGRQTDPTLFERAAVYLRKGTGLFVPKKKKRKKRKKS